MKSIIIFILSVIILAQFAAAISNDDRFIAMKLAANDMVESLNDDDNNTVVDEKKVSNLEKILGDLIERIRVRVEERHQSAQDLLVKAKEIAARLRELHARKSEKLQALLERLSGRVKELAQNLIDRITGRDNVLRLSSDQGHPEDLLEELELDQILMKTFLMSAVEGTEGRFRRDTTEEKKKTTMESIKDTFRGLAEHLFGRYQEFMEWLTTVWTKGIEQAKGHHARIVAIAKEVISDAKDMHKETLREAVEILRPYRKELGNMWNELVEAVNKALKQ